MFYFNLVEACPYSATSFSCTMAFIWEKDILKRAIGVFDSGKGGLTVLKELKETLPYESFNYYGDTANLPFGPKNKAEIIEINRNVTKYLIAAGAKLIVLACNTSSALALPILRKEFPKTPIIGMIGPAASEATAITKTGKIGLFATTATINSHIHKNAIHSLDKSIEVREIATPEFVNIVENGEIEREETAILIKKYLSEMGEVDTIIHGCTHYPYLEAIMKKLQPNISYINPAQGVANLTKTILQDLDLLDSAKIDKEPETRYIVSKYEGGKYVRIDGREYLLGSSSTN